MVAHRDFDISNMILNVCLIGHKHLSIPFRHIIFLVWIRYYIHCRALSQEI